MKSKNCLYMFKTMGGIMPPLKYNSIHISIFLFLIEYNHPSSFIIRIYQHECTITNRRDLSLLCLKDKQGEYSNGVPRDQHRINRCFVFITICEILHGLPCIQRQSKLCLYMFKTLFLIPLRKRGKEGDLFFAFFLL